MIQYKQLHYLITALALVIATLGAVSTVCAQTVTLRLGSITGPKHIETKAEKQFVKLVSKKTSGAVKVELFSSGQLGDAQAQLSAVRQGAQDMYAGGAGNFGKYDKDWNVLNAGFLIRNEGHFKKVLNSDIYKKMEHDLLKKANLRFVMRNGLRAGKPIISTKPIFKPDDFKGLTVRVPPWKSFIATFKGMGAKTVHLPWGETYIGLKQGAADVACATLSGLYGQSLYEVAPYLTMVKFFKSPLTIVINNSRFEALKPQYQKALLKAGREAGQYYMRVAKKEQEKIIHKFISNGAYVIYANPKPFRKKMISVVKQLNQEGAWKTDRLYRKIQDIR